MNASSVMNATYDRPHAAPRQRLARLPLQVERGEVQQCLPGAGIEAELVLRHDDALSLDGEPDLGERRLGVRGEAAGPCERLAHLTHARARFQQRRAHATCHHVAEAEAGGLGIEQPEAPELQGALGREPEEAGELPQAEDALGMGGGHRDDG